MSKLSGAEIERMRGAVDRMAAGDRTAQAVAALLSLIVLAALGVALFFAVLMRYAPQTRNADLPTLVAVIVGMWIIGTLIGWATAQASNPTMAQTDNADLAAAGCLFSIVQFLGGGLYGALRALARGGDPNAAERQAAAVVLASVAASQGAERSAVVATAKEADPTMDAATISAAIRWLAEKNCLEGSHHLRLGPGLQARS